MSWREDLHPRRPDGEFGRGGAGVRVTSRTRGGPAAAENRPLPAPRPRGTADAGTVRTSSAGGPVWTGSGLRHSATIGGRDYHLKRAGGVWSVYDGDPAGGRKVASAKTITEAKAAAHAHAGGAAPAPGPATLPGGRRPRVADVAARARVTTNTPAPARHERVTPVAGTDHADWVLGLRTREQTKPLDKISDDTWGPGDLLLTHVVARQGWDADAASGTAADVDAAVAAGWTEIHRGVGSYPGRPAERTNPAVPAKDAAQLAAETAAGPHQLGTGIYGNGDYFSADATVAQTYADGADTYGSRKRERKKGGGAVIRAALHPQARVIDHDELTTEHRAWMATARAGADSVWKSKLPLDRIGEWEPAEGKYHPSIEAWFYDAGRYAALRGYDAIRVRGKQDGSSRRKRGADQYVILNRTALLVQEGR